MTMGELRDFPIPPALRTGLARLLRRSRRTVILKGCSAALTVFLVGMFLVMLLDRLFVLPQILRTGLSVSVWFLVAGVFWRFMLVPLVRIPRPAALAASVEARHPELAEEFSSSVELVTSEDRPEFRGSTELIDAVVHRAETDSRSVDFAEVVHTERARRFALAAAVLVMAGGLLWTLWRTDFSRLAARFIAPWANLPRVSSTELLVLPGDTVVARGDAQLITAVVQRGRAGSCWLFLRSGTAKWTRLRMTEDEPGCFSYQVASVDNDLEYHLRAADALTQDYRLAAVDRPAVTAIDVTYDYPAYTGLGSATLRGADGNLEAVAGTLATLRFHLNKPLEDAWMHVTRSLAEIPESAEAPPDLLDHLQLEPAADLQYVTRIELKTDAVYTLTLRDHHGFDNRDDTAYAIRIIPDQPPTVQITQPYRALRFARVEPVDVGLLAHDDFGVAKVELVFEINNSGLRRKELPVETLGTPDVEYLYTWMLVSLGLRPGDTIRYYVEVADNHPGTPNVARSQTQFIRISYPDLAQETRIREQNLTRIREQLDRLVRALKDAKTAEEQLMQAARESVPYRSFPAERRRTAQANLDQARDAGTRLAKMLAADPVLNLLKPTADEINEIHVPNAKTEMTRMDPDKKLAESSPVIQTALTETTNALVKAEAIQKQMEDLARLEAEQMKLADLAAKEAQLAQNAAQPEQVDPKKAQDLAQQQEALEKRLEEMMSDADRAAALAQKAQELKQFADAVDDLAAREEKLKTDTDETLDQRVRDITQRRQELDAGDAAEKEALRKELARLMGQEDQPQPEPDPQDRQQALRQQDIRVDTQELARRMSESAVELAGVDPDMARAAEQTAEKLKGPAASKMHQAAGQLEPGRMKPAGEREAEALAELKNAAADLKNLQKKMQQALAKLDRQQPGDPELAAALGQMNAAQNNLQGDTPDGKAASQRMSRAANQLSRAASRRLARGMPVTSIQEPTGMQGALPTDPTQLLIRLGLTVEEWNKLSSELRQELLEGGDERYPAEYRKLIRQYFREISGSAPEKE